MRIIIVYDAFDLVSVDYRQSPDSFLITSHLYNFVYGKLHNYTSKVKDFEVYNDGNCDDFKNCMPDEYCARVLRNESHPTGVIPGLPSCVNGSTCRCEEHRWPVGLISRKVAVVHMGE